MSEVMLRTKNPLRKAIGDAVAKWADKQEEPFGPRELKDTITGYLSVGDPKLRPGDKLHALLIDMLTADIWNTELSQ